jgi:predicted RND superfamily exporter protein
MRGTSERLAPVLMTTLATGLALAPLVILGNRPGQEIENPMAIVILGGLASSSLMNLFVLPALYLRFGRPRDGHRGWRDEPRLQRGPRSRPVNEPPVGAGTDAARQPITVMRETLSET